MSVTRFVARGTAFLGALCPVYALASDGQITGVMNLYMWFVNTVFGSDYGKTWWPVAASLMVLLIIVVMGLVSGLWQVCPEELTDDELLPPRRFGLRAFLEMGWGVVESTLSSVLGEKHWEQFAPVLGGVFFFILLSNLSGIVPGFAPATEQMNMNLAMGIFIFVYFNYYGLKVGGMRYLKHLLGPVWWLSWLLLPIETLGLFARPVSLSLRLTGNISGDHLVYAVFSSLMRNVDLSWIPIPAVFLGFGTFVACLQAFIFMTLSAVYVQLSLDTADDHQ